MRSKSSRSEGSKVKKTKEPNTEGNKIMIESNEGIKIAEDLLSLKTISEIREKIDLIQKDLDLYDQRDKIKDPEDQKNVALDFFKMYLDKASASYTAERAKYYLKSLKKALSEKRTTKINDINLNQWKNYNHIRTDSLWISDRRVSPPENLAWYWGNFIPEIPRQFLMRYTKEDDWVLDPFAGSGTTLFEAARVHRNAIGIELNSDVVSKVASKTKELGIQNGVVTELHQGDTLTLDFLSLLGSYNIKTVQIVFLHPPYHNIIRFSEEPQDLSNRSTVDDFLNDLKRIGEKSFKVLDKGRFLVLVIGDKYESRNLIPLGFLSMNAMMQVGFKIKSIVVKNIENNKGKRMQEDLWRFRALAGGFYIFKHEYIFLFQK